MRHLLTFILISLRHNNYPRQTYITSLYITSFWGRDESFRFGGQSSKLRWNCSSGNSTLKSLTAEAYRTRRLASSSVSSSFSVVFFNFQFYSQFFKTINFFSLYNVTIALEVFLNDMRYINPGFTYLLTYLLTYVDPSHTQCWLG